MLTQGVTDSNGSRRFDSSIGRWASIGPYYAMFPVSFAYRVVHRYCPAGGTVLDPFAGRASSLYAASTTGRTAIGAEINPVGWVYGRAKMTPAPKHLVLARLAEMCVESRTTPADTKELPPFFRWCYSPRILAFLATARRRLDWRKSSVDRTLAAILLVYLHGKRGAALSNQMRDGKSMAPDYAQAWWREQGLRPPSFDPFTFLAQRIEWRYAKGIPPAEERIRLILGDCRPALRRVSTDIAFGRSAPVDLLFTSPPYWRVTNYHYDQWLRLWLLGGPAQPERLGPDAQARFESQSRYTALLDEVFEESAATMSKRGVAYVRTDAREFTLDATEEALRTAFPRKRVRMIQRPLGSRSQTALFGDKGAKPGEVDLIVA